MNIMQHLLVECDKHVASLPVRSAAQKDSAATHFLCGALGALRFAPHGFSPPLHQIEQHLYLINLGGYQRIHKMAQDVLENEANPAQREVKGG
jgi:hypothetical protein